MSVSTKIQIITPQMAEEWLKGKIHNRPLRENICFKYAELIEKGRFRLTHQGIAFDEEGRLIDGQHRLQGISLSRIPTQMMVTTGLPLEVMRYVDTGQGRNVRDNIAIATGKTPDAHRVKVAMAILRMSSNRRKTKITADEVEDILREHAEALDFVMPLAKCGKPGISVAWLSAVFMRAYYAVARRGRLTDLLSFLISGYMEDDDPCKRIAVRLRDYLIDGTGSAESKTQPTAAYMRVERTVRAYLEGEGLMKLCLATEEQFPLPGEAVTAIKRGVVGEYRKNQQSKAVITNNVMTKEQRSERSRKAAQAREAKRATTVTRSGRL